MKQTRFFNSSNGMSIMAAMVGVVIMGLVMMGLVSFVRQSGRERLANNQHFESDNLRTLAKNIVKTRPNCGLPPATVGAGGAQVTFAGNDAANTVNLSATEVAVPSLGGNQIAPGAAFNSIQLNNMQLVNVVRGINRTDGTGTLRLNAVKRQRTGATADLVNDVPVQLRFSNADQATAIIEECFSDDSDVASIVDSNINNSFGRYLRRFFQDIDTTVNGGDQIDVDTVETVVNNPVVRQLICQGITGATWDEVARQCAITSVVNNPGNDGNDGNDGQPGGGGPGPASLSCKGYYQWYTRGNGGALRAKPSLHAACTDSSAGANVSAAECPNGYAFISKNSCNKKNQHGWQTIQCCYLQ